MRALAVHAWPFLVFAACGSRTGLTVGGDAAVVTVDASPPLGVLCAASTGEVAACITDTETGPIQRCNASYPHCVRANTDWGPSQDGAYACCQDTAGRTCAWLGDCE